MKKTLALAFALLLALCLTACSGNDYTGRWEYNDYLAGYELYSGGTGYYVTQNSGSYGITWVDDGDYATVYDENGDFHTYLSFDYDGNLIDDAGNTLVSVSGFSFE